MILMPCSRHWLTSKQRPSLFRTSRISTTGAIKSSPNSYLQVVTFDGSGPVAEAILASSQTPDPASPFHADQTRLYAQKRWVRLPFSRGEVRAAAIAPPTVLTMDAHER
jgi:acyl-homoserine lactone acylase PvdQ